MVEVAHLEMLTQLCYAGKNHSTSADMLLFVLMSLANKKLI
jgi:hypothetical protein